MQKYIILMALFTLTLVGCKDDNNEGGGSGSATVTFTTEVNTRSLTDVTTTLEEDGETICLFASETSTLSAGKEIPMYRLTRENGKWESSSTIEVAYSSKLYFYAVYPYEAAEYGTPDAIPVGIENQTDYLYCGAGIYATYAQPAVVLKMKHALPILSFNIKKDNYSGEGKLQQISIGGENFYTQGTMNIVSGDIKGTTEGSYTLKVNQEINEEGWTENIPDFFCLPFIASGSDVMLNFQIDNKTYTCPMPQYGIVRGIKYIFRLALTDKGLTLFPDPETIAMNEDSDNMPQEGYGILKISHIGENFKVPSFTGEHLVGTIYWNEEEKESYTPYSEHNYQDGDEEHTIVIETWGAEKVTLPDIEGITVIDLSEF